MRIEIRIAGAGGHGIVFAGRLLGTALVEKGFEVFMRVSYSPAQRGGWSCADIVVSDREILSPLVESPHILVVTTQDRYDNEIANVRRDGYVVYESDTVHPTNSSVARHIPVPAFRIAEKVAGSRQFGNSVLIGFLAYATRLVDLETLVRSLDKIGARAKDRNIKALEAGYSYAREHGVEMAIR